METAWKRSPLFNAPWKSILTTARRGLGSSLRLKTRICAAEVRKELIAAADASKEDSAKEVPGKKGRREFVALGELAVFDSLQPNCRRLRSLPGVPI
jgi:hypothetical protein